LINNELQTIIDTVERLLPLQKWKFNRDIQFFSRFKPGYRDPCVDSFGKPYAPTVIYSSDRCRIRFILDDTGYGRSIGLYVSYGRLHAPDDEQFIQWEGENCYCWHREISLALYFLDGISPNEAVENRGKLSPKGLQDFVEKNYPSTEYMEIFLKYNATAWAYYGDSLFNLFDLRHPNLWNQYTDFLREYYDIYGRFNIKPALDKIC
jgi:hypothetical protein